SAGATGAPAAATSAAADRERSASRPATATDAPSAASASAPARPMPPVPPTTRNDLSLTCRSIATLRAWGSGRRRCQNVAVGLVTGRTLWETLERRAQISPDATMLADDTGRRITWAEFQAWAERVAAGLHRLGIGRGSVVSLQLPTRAETVVLS